MIFYSQVQFPYYFILYFGFGFLRLNTQQHSNISASAFVRKFYILLSTIIINNGYSQYINDSIDTSSFNQNPSSFPSAIHQKKPQLLRFVEILFLTLFFTTRLSTLDILLGSSPLRSSLSTIPFHPSLSSSSINPSSFPLSLSVFIFHFGSIGLLFIYFFAEKIWLLL